MSLYNLSCAADRILDLRFEDMMDLAERLSEYIVEAQSDPSCAQDLARALVGVARGLDTDYREERAREKQAAAGA